MPGGQLVVCESSGTWAVRLRRVLRNHDGWRVVETRSPHDCRQQLSHYPGSIAAWEGSGSDVESLARCLLEQARLFPRSPSVVLCTRPAARYERLWREAGAIHVVRSPRHLSSIVGIVRRHSVRFPERPKSLEPPVWQQLPWGPPASELDPHWRLDPSES
jgi:hypothetical protein